MTPVRGRIYWADLGYGEKPWVCVSNNGRNAALDGFLAVRITTTEKHIQNTSIVPLGPTDPVVGYAMCDDLNQLFRDEIKRDGGAMSLRTMTAIGTGLRAALALL